MKCKYYNEIADECDYGGNIPSGWISVKKDLPKESGQYNVYFEGCVNPYATLIYDAELEMFYDEDMRGGELAPTHWQPLPVPPKEGE